MAKTTSDTKKKSKPKPKTADDYIKTATTAMGKAIKLQIEEKTKKPVQQAKKKS